MYFTLVRSYLEIFILASLVLKRTLTAGTILEKNCWNGEWFIEWFTIFVEWLKQWQLALIRDDFKKALYHIKEGWWLSLYHKIYATALAQYTSRFGHKGKWLGEKHYGSRNIQRDIYMVIHQGSYGEECKKVKKLARMPYDFFLSFWGLVFSDLCLSA